MKKTRIMLPLACSVSILLGQAVPAHAQEQTLRVEPVMSVKHSEPGLEIWYKIGRFHQENKRLDLAIQAYRHVLDHEPDNVDARNALATVYSQQSRFDESVAEYEALLQANPKLSYVYNNLGYAYFLKADYLNAASAFGNAIAIEPRNRRAFGNLVLAYEHLGDVDPAVTPASSSLAQAEQLKEPEQSAPVVASLAETPVPDTAQSADTATATPVLEPAVIAQTVEAAEAAAPAVAVPPALKGIEIEIANGTPDAGLGEYLANAFRDEGATVTRVTGLEPYTQRRNVIQYRDGFYEQALALSRSFTNPPALVNYTHSGVPYVKPNVRLVLGKEALQSADVANAGESGSAL
jgi:Flp pilus assembly protein TadD